MEGQQRQWNLEAEYDDIFDKYTRRIERFIEHIKMPTCFFRMVRTKDEIGYIVNHVDYIDGTLKKSNDKNIYIFGGGVYGISLYRYLVKRGIRIEAVIDNNRAGREFPNDVPVISPDDIESNSNILISVINEAFGLDIRNQIKDKELIYGME